ncbi:2OG-Fe(II) oxygenase [Gimesia aquarii]|uniref:Prolyl 4-hydroxylase alpha subunit domain-containing protein n=1 Tax=Gimesia aquarii TaxID=2527964 RepID=A0A517WNK9_9PLAN|nr:2OG-Fe(II) oxygenase [Gimesia aquarii]QDU06850.1 hypothetical protein V202x_01930 [Gimesia aquarii]
MLEIAKNILVIENFLTSEECINYIEYSEYLGYQAADVDVHGVRKQIKEIRTNERADIESQNTADDLWEKLKHYQLPETELGKAVGLSPFIRFYRYSGQQKFNMHKDGIKRHQGFESRYTMIVYLNTILEGGETAFRTNDLEIKPKEGHCLLFAHELWHTGKPVTCDETKYVLRTDVFYKTSQ